jgi:hypothetical protein
VIANPVPASCTAEVRDAVLICPEGAIEVTED